MAPGSTPLLRVNLKINGSFGFSLFLSQPSSSEHGRSSDCNGSLGSSMNWRRRQWHLLLICPASKNNGQCQCMYQISPLQHTHTPSSYCSILERLEELEYRRVKLHGHFEHSRELYMWPRSLNTEGTRQKNAEPGAHVITPFYCNETQ